MKYSGLLICLLCLVSCSTIKLQSGDETSLTRLANQDRERKSKSQAFVLASNRKNTEVTANLKSRYDVECASRAQKELDINGDGQLELMGAAYISPYCNGVASAGILVVLEQKSKWASIIHRQELKFSTIGDPEFGSIEDQIQEDLDDLLVMEVISAKDLPIWQEDNFTPTLYKVGSGMPFEFSFLADRETYLLAQQKKLPVICYYYRRELNCLIMPDGMSELVTLFKLKNMIGLQTIPRSRNQQQQDAVTALLGFPK